MEFVENHSITLTHPGYLLTKVIYEYAASKGMSLEPFWSEMGFALQSGLIHEICASVDEIVLDCVKSSVYFPRNYQNCVKHLLYKKLGNL